MGTPIFDPGIGYSEKCISEITFPLILSDLKKGTFNVKTLLKHSARTVIFFSLNNFHKKLKEPEWTPNRGLQGQSDFFKSASRL